ncbi:ATP-binding protein [Pseudoalteromonas sp. B137]
MIIGLFGLSGSGKSTLTKNFNLKNPEYIATSASKIIADAKRRILLNELNNEIVTDNQKFLILGFEELRKKNPNKNIIIELHNVIETPSGIVEIASNVFEDLKLDIAFFLSVKAEELLEQRNKDKDRARLIPHVDELAKLENRAIELFEALPIENKLILNDDYLIKFERFIHKFI